MESLLKDKICVVTGASRGIGAAIAALFRSEGAKVYTLSRSAPPAAPAAAAAAEASGTAASPAPSPDPFWIPCDVSDEASVEAALARILGAEGRVDVLVNNAGMTRDGLLMRMKTEDWDAVLSTNLKSAFLLSRAVVRPMLKQKSGCILNVSSVVGISGNGGQANYSASKAGLIGLTKSLAREVGSRGIRVNAIAPGFIETAMTDKIPEDFKQKLKESIPLGRVGDPDEAAKAALFLCSPLASYITGVVLRVDGGMGM
jgi:3-oxoacyl-[acyl-carrier protein] reductase